MPHRACKDNVPGEEQERHRATERERERGREGERGGGWVGGDAAEMCGMYVAPQTDSGGFMSA